MNAGDLVWADLDPTVGREQKGQRPVLLLTEPIAGQVIAVPLSHTDRYWRSHVRLAPEPGATQPSVAMCEQVRSLSTSRVDGHAGRVEDHELAEVRDVLGRLLGII